MPINSFVCQRRSCQSEFEASFDPSNGASPFCPVCGGKPCKWLPKSCNYGKVAPGQDRGMQELVDEHNERTAENPAMKITNIRTERGLPAVRPASQGPTVKKVFQGPLGPMEANVAEGPLRHGRASFGQGIIADMNMAKIPVNKDGRPPTDMALLGGIVPRPPIPRPDVVKKG